MKQMIESQRNNLEISFSTITDEAVLLNMKEISNIPASIIIDAKNLVLNRYFSLH